jgi:ABC-type glutathione transport system ATPase component
MIFPIYRERSTDMALAIKHSFVSQHSNNNQITEMSSFESSEFEAGGNLRDRVLKALKRETPKHRLLRRLEAELVILERGIKQPATITQVVAYKLGRKAVTKRFGKTRAVSRISISIQAGEIFGFLGANGAGKRRQSACCADCPTPVIELDQQSDRERLIQKRRRL